MEYQLKNPSRAIFTPREEFQPTTIISNPIAHSTIADLHSNTSSRPNSSRGVGGFSNTNRGAWKELLSKTSDCKVPKNETTYS